MNKNRVRVLRILEYVGECEWVEKTLKNSYIPMIGQKGFGDNAIKSTVIDLFPETMEETSKEIEKVNSNKDDYVYNEDIGNKLFKIIENRFNIDSRLASTQDNLFDDLNLDELDVQELIMELENVFNVKLVHDDNASKVKYIKDLIKLVQNNIR